MILPLSPVGDAPLLFLEDESFGKIVEMLLWYGWNRDSPDKNLLEKPRYPYARFDVGGSRARTPETLRVLPNITFTTTTHPGVSQTEQAEIQDKWDKLLQDPQRFL